MNSGENKTAQARELCEQGRWPDALAFARGWRSCRRTRSAGRGEECSFTRIRSGARFF
jgi:hypothetical protein